MTKFLGERDMIEFQSVMKDYNGNTRALKGVSLHEDIMPTVSFNDRFDRLSTVSIPMINDFYVREYKKFW